MVEANVRLTVPIDFAILEQMTDGKRHTAPELASKIEWKQNYIGDELRDLEGYGLVERVPDSAMFVISNWGRKALKYCDGYEHAHSSDWGKFVRGQLTEDEFQDAISSE